MNDLYKMKSNLNKIDFKRRLIDLTSREKFVYFITPYNFSGKPFCGDFDDSTFTLTKNSFWRHVKAIQIKGEYKQFDKNSTEVIYKIGYSDFMRYAAVAFFSIVFIGFNVVLISFTEEKVSKIISFNIFLCFMGLLGFVVTWISKKIVTQRFEEEFDIDKT